jgi:hypothetical protein
MPKLSELIRFNPQRSSLDVTCEANPRHVSKIYYDVVIEMPHAVLERAKQEITDVLPVPQLHIVACSNCVIEFMGDVHEKIAASRELMA